VAQTWDSDISIFGVLFFSKVRGAYFLSFGQGNRKGGVFERVIYPQGQQRGQKVYMYIREVQSRIGIRIPQHWTGQEIVV